MPSKTVFIHDLRTLVSYLLVTAIALAGGCLSFAVAQERGPAAPAGQRDSSTSSVQFAAQQPARIIIASTAPAPSSSTSTVATPAPAQTTQTNTQTPEGTVIPVPGT